MSCRATLWKALITKPTNKLTILNCINDHFVSSDSLFKTLNKDTKQPVEFGPQSTCCLRQPSMFLVWRTGAMIWSPGAVLWWNLHPSVIQQIWICFKRVEVDLLTNRNSHWTHWFSLMTWDNPPPGVDAFARERLSQAGLSMPVIQTIPAARAGFTTTCWLGFQC